MRQMGVIANVLVPVLGDAFYHNQDILINNELKTKEENKQLFKGGFKYCFLLLLRIFKAFHAPLETALLHKLFWLVLPKKWSDTLYYKLIDLLTQANIYNYLCP